MTRPTLRVIRDEHAALAAMLRSMTMMIRQGPGEAPDQFFDVVRAMLFYIDEFPEKRHHPKESDLLFPALARAVPSLMPVIRRLESDHMSGEGRARALQHLLLAWELLGETRRDAFCEAATDYVAFYLDHMRTEERELLPAAEAALSEAEWTAMDKAFLTSLDPLAGGVRDPVYERLFTRIVMAAPAPIGVGPRDSVATAA
ncbi:MAG: hemerythrin domain-containing protein [Pseudomonadota bacterium]